MRPTLLYCSLSTVLSTLPIFLYNPNENIKAAREKGLIRRHRSLQAFHLYKLLTTLPSLLPLQPTDNHCNHIVSRRGNPPNSQMNNHRGRDPQINRSASQPIQPTTQPTLEPFKQPSRQPNKIPTSQPSSMPSVQLLILSTTQPSHRPSHIFVYLMSRILVVY